MIGVHYDLGCCSEFGVYTEQGICFSGDSVGAKQMKHKTTQAQASFKELRKQSSLSFHRRLIHPLITKLVTKLEDTPSMKLLNI